MWVCHVDYKMSPLLELESQTAELPDIGAVKHTYRVVLPEPSSAFIMTCVLDNGHSDGG